MLINWKSKQKTDLIEKGSYWIEYKFNYWNLKKNPQQIGEKSNLSMPKRELMN